jgi:hypothetical protein
MWIRKTEYKRLKSRTNELTNMINSLQAELNRFKEAVPYKCVLKATPYDQLISIARHEHGIPESFIFNSCTNKADLIDEILNAQKELNEI